MENTEICGGTDYEDYKIDEETLDRLIAKERPMETAGVNRGFKKT